MTHTATPNPDPTPAPLKIDLHERDGVLVLRAEGDYRQSEYIRAAKFIREQAVHTGTRLVLVDARGVRGNPPDSDRVQIAIYAANLWAGVVRVAMVCRPEVINRFGETMAQNRGADFMVTESEEKAFAWLTN